MRNSMKLGLALVLGSGCLQVLLSQSLAEPPTGQNNQISAFIGIGSQRNSSEPSPPLSSLLTAARERGQQEGSSDVTWITSLPRQRSSPVMSPGPTLAPKPTAKVPSQTRNLARMPFVFIENRGQVDELAKFYSRTRHQTLRLTQEGLVSDLLRARVGLNQVKPTSTPNAFAPKHRPWERQELQPERLAFSWEGSSLIDTDFQHVGAIAGNAASKAHVTGVSKLPDFPTTNPSQPALERSPILAVAAAQPSLVEGKSITGGTLTAGNAFYKVHVEDVPGFGVGLYTITTGPAHPAGSGLNVLFGGGSPGTTFNTIRSYTSGTDYVQDTQNKSSVNTVVSLDPFGTATPIGTTGFRTTYMLPGPPTTPDALTIISDVKVNGTTFEDSTIEVTTDVINDGNSSVTIGIRYLWDFQIGDDDGPTFQQINPNSAVRVNEAEFIGPAFMQYRIEDNDVNPSPPTFFIFGTVTGPATVTPTPPDLLQYVCWPDAFDTSFGYTVDQTRDIATTVSDCQTGTGGG